MNNVEINITRDPPWTFELKEGLQYLPPVRMIADEVRVSDPVHDAYCITAHKSRGLTTQQFMALYQNDEVPLTTGRVTSEQPNRQSVKKCEYYESERKTLPSLEARRKYGRYGQPWSDEELEHLQQLFARGLALDEVCDRMSRPPEGVSAKLEKLGYIKPVPISFRYAISVRGHRVRQEWPENYRQPAAKVDFDNLEVRTLVGNPMPCTSGITISTPSKYRTTTEETTMSNQILNGKAIVNQTLVFGVESHLVTDEQIYGYIKQLEDEIVRLEAIKAKPAKLKARIAELQGKIDELVKFVDGR